MNYEVRKAGIEDIPSILNIQEVVWPLLYENKKLGISKKDVIKSMNPKSDNYLKLWERIISTQKDGAGQGKTLVGCVDDKVVGFVYAVQEETKGEIRSLYLLPKYRGKKLGQALLEGILSKLDNSKEITLSVTTYADDAVKLYKKFGFQRTGTSSQKLINGKEIPEFVMTLSAK